MACASPHHAARVLLLALALALALAAAAHGARKHHDAKHTVGLKRSLAAHGLGSASSSPQGDQGFFNQTLDHFTSGDTRTWLQRFQVNATHHKPGGPIFLLLGGEGAVRCRYMCMRGWWWWWWWLPPHSTPCEPSACAYAWRPWRQAVGRG